MVNLLLDDGSGLCDAGIFDVCSWWIESYPDDVFVSEPVDVVAVRDLMRLILSRRKNA